jgi:hypothetical protein
LAVLLVLNRAFWEPVRRHEFPARYFSQSGSRMVDNASEVAARLGGVEPRQTQDLSSHLR